MKASVTLTFDIDTSDYVGVEPTQTGAENLVRDMLDGDECFPNGITMDVRMEPRVLGGRWPYAKAAFDTHTMRVSVADGRVRIDDDANPDFWMELQI